MPRASKPKTGAKASAGLSAYKARRDFRRTSEPPPKRAKAAAGKFRFVVQKHDARRLHFDLRLELGGVLKSWAVTRGPSMTAGVRRLAVETEDHPVDYLDWEGVIPKGQYGGGTMIVWDQGTWQPEGDPEAALKAGKLSFDLAGERLKGKWTLVRMAKRTGEKRSNWLLIKSRDAFALKPREQEPVESMQTSVKSGREGADLAAAGAVRTDHRARQATAKSGVAATAALARIAGARKAIMPGFVPPSLALAVDRPPDGPEWIHEIKHDGYRIQARCEGGKATLLTRKGLDWTARFPPIARSLAGLSVGAALLDGEIVVHDENGQSSFSGLQRDLKSRRHDRLAYYVFDLLYCNGVDLQGAALTERKRILNEIIAASPASPALRYNDHIETGGQPVLTEACRLGLEGIVSKRSDLPYISGRGDHWQKSKCALRQEFVVLGYVPSSVKGKAVGSLVLGYYNSGKLMHAGRAGTGIDDDMARTLGSRLDAMRNEMPELGNSPAAASLRDVVWTEPSLVAEIEYRGWSSDGLLRQAAFKGLREDKPASEVTLETARPQAAPELAKPKTVAAASAGNRPAPVAFTHPGRVLWSDPDITKRDLADYYTAIADKILPELSGRVLNLRRCPDGAAGQCFFAKHAWMGLNDAIQLIDTGDEKPMLAIDSLEGLLTLVQMNVLEIHTWGSKVDHLERPDRMTFDLDPGESVPASQVTAAAREVRDRLDRLGLQSFLKSTGGKGLHVVVPLDPVAGWDEVKAFSKAFADVMAQDNPRLYLSTMSKARRQGRVFVDYLRNGRGATAIAAYSTRSRPHAPVAMPLAWSEIGDAIPLFNVETAQRRLQRLNEDPWQNMASLKQKLPDLH